MKRFLVGLAIVLAVLLIALYAFQGPITLRLMDNVVAQRINTNLIDELPDGLHVALCGAGSPLPDPARSGPCTAMAAEAAGATTRRAGCSTG